jgi:altronate dehydratase small subunit
MQANKTFPIERRVMLTKHAIVLNSKDNVATVVEDVEPGSGVRIKSSDGETTVVVKEKIPAGHKFAIANIAVGQPTVKYGETIGIATHNILVGDYVHVHNVESCRGRGDK